MAEKLKVDPWDITAPRDAGGEPTLEELLRARIRTAGAMTFAEFMATALYEPRFGYYTTGVHRMGREGDYVTSPEVHPVFGALIAKQVVQCWELLGEPGSLRLIEAGAGNGSLARDVLVALEALGLPPAIEYVIVEPFERVRRHQEDAILGTGRPEWNVRWVAGLGEIEPGENVVVLSNELLDAFPVHRVVVRDGELREVCVGLEGDRFVEVEASVSDAALLDYFADLGVFPGEGCYAEVNLQAPAWITDVARLVARGFVLTFDYGATAEELYAPWRRDGTLLCFWRQAPVHDPYARIGRQDMTASVDFTTLVRAGRKAGLEPLGLARQSEVLVALGIGDGIGDASGVLGLERYMERRRAATELLDPAGLGRILVLAQGRGVGRPHLLGFPEGPPGLL
ncbi:MAG TPA: SAM-dependent methyltransferase [Dehalococcoidia bacterium]|nr:SAM-dependent methyltransferase [Dehalococcoidia bacterium]